MYDAEISYIEIWFANQNSIPLKLKDKVNLAFIFDGKIIWDTIISTTIMDFNRLQENVEMSMVPNLFIQPLSLNRCVRDSTKKRWSD